LSNDTIDGVFDPDLHGEDPPYEPTPIRNAVTAAIVAIMVGLIIAGGLDTAFEIWTRLHG